MFITRKHLSRRTVLKGAGGTLALPFLSAMVPAATANALEGVIPRRMAFMYIPHGAILSQGEVPMDGLARTINNNETNDRWTPNGVGRDFELVGDLASLAPYREQVTVISNLNNSVAAANTPHGVHAGSWLTSTVPVRGLRTYPDRISIDQRALPVIGRDTPLPSLELGTEPGGPSDPNYGWGFGQTLAHTSTMPLQPNYNPRNVFFQLFGRGSSPEERDLIRAENRSILDSMRGDITSLTAKLGRSDQAVLDQFLESVFEVERRIQAAVDAGVDRLDVPPTPAGVPNAVEDHLALMFQLMALAFQAGLTNAITFLTSKEVSMRVFPGLSITTAWHPLSHQTGSNRLTRSNIVRMYTEQFTNNLVARLAEMPEGEGSVLDNSVLVWGSGMGDASAHNFGPLPTVLVGRAGGSINGGQHLIYPQGTPLNNLWVTLLNRHGVPTESLGNSTGELLEV